MGRLPSGLVRHGKTKHEHNKVVYNNCAHNTCINCRFIVEKDFHQMGFVKYIQRRCFMRNTGLLLHCLIYTVLLFYILCADCPALASPYLYIDGIPEVVDVDEVITASIMMDGGVTDLTAASIMITYDSGYIEIIDQDSNQPGINIAPGSRVLGTPEFWGHHT